MKKFLSVFLTACICVAMVGCSKSDEIPATDDSADNSSATSDVIKYQPSDEIINADFSSGLLQIGDEIIHIGGYMTVAEICEQLKGKYTYEEQFYDREYSAKNRPILYLTGVEDEELSIYLEYCSPVNGTERTVPNCVVMFACPSNKYTRENTWLPTGIPSDSSVDRTNDIIKVFEDKGFKDVSSEDYANKFMSENYAEHTGCYVKNYNDTYTIFSVELEGNNLINNDPSFVCFWITEPSGDSDINNFFYGNSISYWDTVFNRQSYLKSSLR